MYVHYTRTILVICLHKQDILIGVHEEAQLNPFHYQFHPSSSLQFAYKNWLLGNSQQICYTNDYKKDSYSIDKHYTSLAS